MKGVAGYGDLSQSSNEDWMSFASSMAASLVAHILCDPVVFQGWPHYHQGRSLGSAGPQMIPRPTMQAESLRSFLDKARKRKAQILAKPSFKQLIIILEKQRIVVLNLQWTPS